MSKQFFLISLIIILLFSGCRQPPYPKYTGKDTVILKYNFPNIIEAQLGQLFTMIKIDNLTTNPLYLKPGKHTITMHAIPSSPFSPLSAKSTTSFDFKANRTYTVKAESFIAKKLVVFSIYDITEEKEKLEKTIYAEGYL